MISCGGELNLWQKDSLSAMTHSTDSGHWPAVRRGQKGDSISPSPPGHAHFHMWRSSRQRHKTTAVSEKIHRSSRIQTNVLISVEIKLLLLNEGKNKYPDHVTSLHQSHLPQTINPFKCKSETIRGCRLHFLTFQWNVTQCDKLEKICTISADHCVYCVADQ